MNSARATREDGRLEVKIKASVLHYLLQLVSSYILTDKRAESALQHNTCPSEFEAGGRRRIIRRKRGSVGYFPSGTITQLQFAPQSGEVTHIKGTLSERRGRRLVKVTFPVYNLTRNRFIQASSDFIAKVGLLRIDPWVYCTTVSLSL